MKYRLSQLGVLAGTVLYLLVIACSSSDSTPTTSPGGSNASGTGAATNTTASTATPGTQLAPAGSELSAYALLDAAGYTAALGEPVTGVEDDGVVPDRYGCEIGQARALTAAGVLITTTLRTADSTDNAKQEYSSLANFGSTPSPLSGVGDQSAYSYSLALVQKGAQVLRVTSEIAPGVDPKATTGDPTAALAAAAAIAGKAAPALAGKMSGQACNGPALGIPAGAIPPCSTTAKEIEDALHITGVTAMPVISDKPPASECEYDLGGHAGPVYVYSRTEAQLQASIAPTSTADAYATELATATNPRNAANAAKSFEYGQFKGFGYTASGPLSLGLNDEMLFIKPTSQTAYHPAASGSPSVAAIILQILQSPSASLIKPDDCQELIQLFLDDGLQDFHTDLTVTDTEYALRSVNVDLTTYCFSAVILGPQPTF